MKKHSLKATILAGDRSLNISYAVCLLEQITYEDDTFIYKFTPCYNVMELLSSAVFQGIPGLNLDLKEEVYVRENRMPTFIYERTPQRNREDLWELLDEVRMEYLDPLEWLIRTDKIYTGDNLTVEAFHSPGKKKEPGRVFPGDRFTLDDLAGSGVNYEIIKFLLEVVIKGAFLESDGFSINDETRFAMHKLLLPLYKNEVTARKKKQDEGIAKARQQNKYTGRKRKNVSIPLLAEIIEKRERKEISVAEAMKELGLTSRSTFYRRVREFKSGQENRGSKNNTKKPII